eukprot:scaffold149_cov315-Pinguiococcus_pyrenoidosus.AAC.85
MGAAAYAWHERPSAMAAPSRTLQIGSAKFFNHNGSNSFTYESICFRNAGSRLRGGSGVDGPKTKQKCPDDTQAASRTGQLSSLKQTISASRRLPTRGASASLPRRRPSSAMAAHAASRTTWLSLSAACT